jgi:hypothetical protein
MSETLTKEEDLKYQLMEFSNSDPSDLDTTFEVCYETASGGEAWIDVCAIELAERALKRIEELEAKLEDVKKAARSLLGVEPTEVVQKPKKCQHPRARRKFSSMGIESCGVCGIFLD